MANSPAAKGAKPHHHPRRRTHKHLGDAYVAKIVGARAIWHFLQGGGTKDRAVAWIAGQQLGLITIAQLAVVGLSRGEIAGLVERGALHRLHRGVYLVGHSVLLPGARELAAVLACGRTAMVSHRSAARLLGLDDQSTDDVQVTVVARNCRSREGIRVHRVERLDPLDRGFLRGIPITAPPRTIIDFAALARGYEIERVVAEAYARELLTEDELYAAIDRAPSRPGIAALRAELGREAGPQWTQSEGERRMLKLIRAAGLPAPQTQVRIAGWPADFLWADRRLIVEVDGYPFHSGRKAFERDRRRDQAHIAAGYTVIRVTWRQLTEEPLSVAATIARLLEREPR
jgi:very-short-patch-repair endonuclease